MTIMVLELRPPHGTTLASLRPLAPVFLSYLLSFIFLGIYWNNHHHMLQRAKHVNGAILWANLHLLFWLSMIPFVTAWLGENGLDTGPVAAYGLVLLCCAVSYTILAMTLVRAHGRESVLAAALGTDLKGKASLALYAIAVLLAFLWPPAACAVYVFVALVWLVPDRRFELHDDAPKSQS
jgi:uncharacterized membrane protein